MATSLPGTNIILTNLLYKLNSAGNYSHLETSTETQVSPGLLHLHLLLQVFSGEAAEDSRFADDPVVAAYREAGQGKEMVLGCLVKERGSYGGHLLPEEVGRSEHLEVVRSREEVVGLVERLGWREGWRLRVEGRVGPLASSTEGWGKGQVFSGRVGHGSQARRVGGLGTKQLEEEVRDYCQLGEISRCKEGVLEGLLEGEVVKLLLADCHLMVYCGEGCREEVQEAEGRRAEIIIDLFRLEVAGERAGEGVEAVVRKVTVLKRDMEEERHDGEAKKLKLDEENDDLGDDDSNESDWSIHTQDLLDCI